jgi:ribosome-associated toxin RatA of RatAB toxin-antitoxin module
VGSDSNSHSLLWRSGTPNTRGNQVEEFLATHDLVIKNTGKEFTFVNTMGHKTIIDITFTSRSLDDTIANWAVNTSESLSDHKRIEFNLEFDCSRTIESRNYNTANWGLFDSIIVRKIELPDTKSKWDGPRLDLEAEKFERIIKYALNKTCPNKIIKLGVNKFGGSDWFQPETKRLSNLAKKYAKELRANPTAKRKMLYTDTRRQLQNNIRANKRECNQNVCANIVDMKSYSKIVKSIVGTKAPPIGMLIDPNTGTETIPSKKSPTYC